MDFPQELLRIAHQDLKVTRILHKKEFYPQAVYSFQQSVEKANKAYGLMFGIIEEKDLKKDIGPGLTKSSNSQMRQEHLRLLKHQADQQLR